MKPAIDKSQQGVNMMLDLFRLFVQVVEEESYTAVAKRLGISQPAVSNQMRALEDKLNAKLFMRKGKGFILTSQGEMVFLHAQRILEEWNSLNHELGHTEGEIAGRVHIGASHIPGEYLLPFYISELQRSYPKMTFKVSIGDSLEMAQRLLTNEVDFAVVGSLYETEKIVASYWLKDELKVLLPKDHPLASYHEVKIQDLMNFPMIIREGGSGHRQALEEGLAHKGLKLEDFKIGVEAGSLEAAKNAVRAGLGYSFLSSFAVLAEDLQSLAICSLKDLNLERSFYILTRRQTTLPLETKVCVEGLLNSTINPFHLGQA